MLPAILPLPLVETDIQGLGARYRGKVRDVYNPGDGRLVLITTDRISAFDHVLRQAIPLKGQVLNTLAADFFDRTRGVAPNHVLAVPHPSVTIAIACEALPVEFVVRGYLAGHAWREYESGRRELCGEQLPEGLVEGQALPRPLLTPSTKAAVGHDEDVSRTEIVSRGLLDRDTLEEAADMALRLFRRGTDLADERGLILVDTKFEFGRAPDGRLLVIDEILTPDSSRYYMHEGYAERLAAGQPQRQLSKEFVREWLMLNGFQGRPGDVMPDMPHEFVREVAARYLELFELVTGRVLDADLSPDPESRIREVLGV